MTLDERVEEAVGAIVRRVGRLELDRIVRESITAAIAEEREACAKIVHEEYLAYTEGGFSASQCLVDAEKKILARARTDEKPP